MNYISLFLEWTGTIVALSGSMIMASQKLSPSIAWKLWAASHFFHSILFLFFTQQYGLLYVQFVGLTITLTGLWQWKNMNKNETIKSSSKYLMNTLTILSSISLVAVFFLSINILSNFTFEKLEWIGALLAVGAALLLASKHRLMNFAWPIWIAGNIVLLVFTINTQQWGLATLQLGFGIINLYGCYVRFFKQNNQLVAA